MNHSSVLCHSIVQLYNVVQWLISLTFGSATLSGIILSGAILVAAARSQTGIHMYVPAGPSGNYTVFPDDLNSRSGDSIVDSFVLYVVNTGALS